MKKIFAGLVFVIASIPLMWWNEGRAVRRTKALDEGYRQLVQADPAHVNAENNAKLVHVAGWLEPDQNVKDEEFGVEIQAMKLVRAVKMYQWEEKKETTKDPNNPEAEPQVTYRYEMGWNKGVIDSRSFAEKGYDNPTSIPYSSKKFEVSNATIGPYSLSQNMFAKMPGLSALSLNGVAQTDKGRVEGSHIYIGDGTDDNPQIGDVKVSFRAIVPDNYTLVARQWESSFQPFNTSNGHSIEWIKQGWKTPEQVFDEEHRINKFLLWMIRAGGILFMILGMTIALKPLTNLTGRIPLLGKVLNLGFRIVAFVLSVAISAVVISLGWIWYRPVLGISLLAIAVAGITWLIVASRRKEKLEASV